MPGRTSDSGMIGGGGPAGTIAWRRVAILAAPAGAVVVAVLVGAAPIAFGTPGVAGTAEAGSGAADAAREEKGEDENARAVSVENRQKPARRTSSEGMGRMGVSQRDLDIFPPENEPSRWWRGNPEENGRVRPNHTSLDPRLP